MTFRKLRIAFSIACGIACVLLIGLWVRSFWWADTAYCPILSPRMLILHSWRGQLSVYAGEENLDQTGLFPSGWGSDSDSYKDIAPSTTRVRLWNYETDRFGMYVSFPHWIPVMFPAALGVAPWIGSISWRFRLRTLLIATTLVAVALGTIVYAVR